MSDSFIQRAAPALLAAALTLAATSVIQITWSIFQTKQTQKEVKANVKSISQLQKNKVSNELMMKIVALLNERDKTLKENNEDLKQEVEKINDRLEEQFKQVLEMNKYRGVEDETSYFNKQGADWGEQETDYNREHRY